VLILGLGAQNKDGINLRNCTGDLFKSTSAFHPTPAVEVRGSLALQERKKNLMTVHVVEIARVA
jgi:hypothetical protein